MRAAVSCLALASLFALASLASAQDKKAESKPATSTVTTSILNFVGLGKPSKTPAQSAAESKGSHEQGTPIKVTSTDGKLRLQTLSVDNDGRVLALVAPPRGYGAPMKGATAEVHVYDGTGKAVKNWKVNFHAHSINAGADGSVYVAGDGKVAKFDKDGKELVQVELPMIAEMLKDKDGMRKAAEEEINQQKASMKQIMEQYTKRVDDLKKVAEDKRTPAQKAQLKQFESIVKSFAENEKYTNSLTVDSVVQGMVSRMRIINGVAISNKDVFIVCGEAKGYGYAVWRMDHEFKNAKRVMTGLSGCCGQMDVQCCPAGDLLVAENTKHQFGRYDRDGKKKGAYGKRGAETDVSCFGGCCNPMNLRVAKSEDVYTAESEGLIKRFNGKGEFVGVVGYAPLTGGCKNVAVGVSPDGSRVYFADQPGSQVIVMVQKAAATRTE